MRLKKRGEERREGLGGGWVSGAVLACGVAVKVGEGGREERGEGEGGKWEELEHKNYVS